ncbi:hypothetical protein K280104A7_33210 [Candidatus Bariatricus faecipullorum]
MQDSEIIRILSENPELFKTSGMVSDVFRTIGFAIIKGLVWLSNVCQEFYNQCFQILDFTTYGPVQEFLSEFDGIVMIVIAVSLLALAIILILRPEKKPNVLMNFLLGMFVFCSSVSLLTSFNSLISDSQQYVSSTYSSDGLAANQIISANMTDLLYIDREVGLANADEAENIHAELSENIIENLDYTETVPADSDSLSTSEAEDILDKKIVYLGSGKDDYILEDIYDGVLMTDFGSDFYYRYNLSFINSVFSILALCILFLVLGYKVIRLVWELLTSQFLAILFSGEIFSGQALRKILDFVKNIYIVLIYIMISVKFYLIATGFIQERITSLTGVALIFLTFAVIDGPNVIEKIIGIDAGLQQGVGKGIALAHMLGGAARTVGGTAQMINQNIQQHRTLQAMENMADALQGGSNGNGQPGTSGTPGTGVPGQADDGREAGMAGNRGNSPDTGNQPDDMRSADTSGSGAASEMKNGTESGMANDLNSGGFDMENRNDPARELSDLDQYVSGSSAERTSSSGQAVPEKGEAEERLNREELDNR